MRQFLDEDFLISTATGSKLFHNHAERLPIIDYHCHLSPRLIAEDHHFATITELWLGGDHYKWRAERANGVSETYITGNASDWEKFEKWAETMPYAFRNPLYHWTHLELRRTFGMDLLLNPQNARNIYERCNEMLRLSEFSARGLLRHFNVEVVCTTDDPIDSLEYHRKISSSGFATKVLPAWRPDKAMAIENPAAYREYISKLSVASDCDIRNYSDLLFALGRRMDFFAANGCKLSDHGLAAFPDSEYTDRQIDEIFDKVMRGSQPTAEETEQYKTALLFELCQMNCDYGWAQQFHFGALRNNNSLMFGRLGSDAGYDSIGEYQNAQALAHMLDRLNSAGKLTRTILYNLNPSENAMLASMIGNFQDGSQVGKMQMGAAWWFNDQYAGIVDQINAISNQGLLSRFVGMLTDSRSFVSYPRHEYFRRILCDIVGRDVDNGLIPADESERISQMVEDISYFNAKRYFKF